MPTIAHPVIPATVTRALSAASTSGAPVTVTLKIAPTANGHCYAVEDTVPAGWVVSGISSSGAYTGGKVKWGPFFDNQARVLTYQLAPGKSAPGHYVLNGVASFDSSNIALPTGAITVVAGHLLALSIHAGSEAADSGAGQMPALTVHSGESARCNIRVVNAGAGAAAFTITAPAGDSGWSVTYRNTDGADITRQLTSTGWTPGTLAPGAAVSIAAQVTPTSLLIPGSSFSLRVTAIAADGSSKADVVIERRAGW